MSSSRSPRHRTISPARHAGEQQADHDSTTRLRDTLVSTRATEEAGAATYEAQRHERVLEVEGERATLVVAEANLVSLRQPSTVAFVVVVVAHESAVSQIPHVAQDHTNDGATAQSEKPHIPPSARCGLFEGDGTLTPSQTPQQRIAVELEQ